MKFSKQKMEPVQLRFAWLTLDLSLFLSLVHINYRFAEAVLKARTGEQGITQPSFMYLPGIPGGETVQKSLDGLEYFSTNVEFGVCLDKAELIKS